ncbi:uncharacterized protein CC84DRAFT_1221733 [Paraphaeosphaeria sporulosa]|uniref:Uncharacterized protein n=1 Tax=Paraphaeosphaeria sporulosa TaxID=1460663 RepID=A0A177C1A5_9PLEO|nr:uncharacterized protein CC84DRAFT_1221733 [Paraphaeosphaeria sporulosa]OAG01206.1 hypothetical protein CC84DRAFT_1221733 [Paraphaeosphaeria sporulosa]
MEFRRSELKSYFDNQLLKLYETIHKQLVRVQEKIPYELVAHMVLSGGFGNAAYNLQIRVVPEPQLVVCNGNVADRMQKLKSGRNVLGWRCCRTSYGTLCKVLYDPNDQLCYGVTTQIDPLYKKPYVMQYIDCFGQPVSSDEPIVQTFKRKGPPATAAQPSPTRMFPTEIICSELDASTLPNVMNAYKSQNPHNRSNICQLTHQPAVLCAA